MPVGSERILAERLRQRLEKEVFGMTLAEGLEQRGDVEDTRPEPRTAVPELVRGGVFPIKARLVKLLAFENIFPGYEEDGVTIKAGSVPGGTADPTSGLPYSGKITNTLNLKTSALEAIGLAQQVNEWLLVAEEIDLLDWELSQDAITGYPRFLIIYTE